MRPQDVLVACRLYSIMESRSDWTYSSLAESVGLSASEAYAAVDRCRLGLLVTLTSDGKPCLLRRNLRDLLVVAVPRIYYARRGGVAQGMATATAALPDYFPAPDLPAVWPSSTLASVRGCVLEPVYPTADVAARDPVVYQLLALSDVARVGTRTEVTRAAEVVDKVLQVR